MNRPKLIKPIIAIAILLSSSGIEIIGRFNSVAAKEIISSTNLSNQLSQTKSLPEQANNPYVLKGNILAAVANIYGELARQPELESTIELALVAIEEIPDSNAYKASVLSSTVAAIGYMKRSPKAETFLDKAIAIIDEIPMPSSSSIFGGSKIDFWEKIIITVGKLENLSKTETYLERAVTAIKENSNFHSQNFTLELAKTYGKLGQISRLEQYLQQTINTQEFSVSELAIIYRDIAEIYANSGQISQAEQKLQQAIAASKNISNGNKRGSVVQGIIEIVGNLEQLPEVEPYLAQGTTIANEISAPNSQANLLIAIAETYAKRDRSTEAHKYLKQALTGKHLEQILAVAENTPDMEEKSKVIRNIIEAMGRFDRFSEVEQSLGQVAALVNNIDVSKGSLSEKVETLHIKSLLLNKIASTYAKFGQTAAANEYLEKALKPITQGSNTGQARELQIKTAETYGQLQQLSEAQELLEKALIIGGGSFMDKNRQQVRIAETYVKLGLLSEAEKVLAKILADAESNSDVGEKLWILEHTAIRVGTFEELPAAGNTLQRVLSITNNIPEMYFSEKVTILLKISEAYGKQNRLSEAKNTLEIAINMVNNISVSEKKQEALN